MYLRPRALALARRCFGLCVALSVVERWGVLRACYSDAGVLPVAAWRDDVGDDSLHPMFLYLSTHSQNIWIK